jgi:hypothetical protein
VIRTFWSGATTAVWSAGIAWIKPGSVLEGIAAPSAGVIDVLLNPWGVETEILMCDAIPLQLRIPSCQGADFGNWLIRAA